MLDPKMQDAFNDQINAELYSSYLYLSMAAHFESINLAGFANWMRVQVQEENFHAMKMYDFVNERRGRVVLAAIDEPKAEWTSPLEVFQDTYEHETKVTGLINNLVTVARELKDHASDSFLQWFVGEQVEEEQNADKIVQELKLMEGFPGGLFMIDRELAARVFVPPVAAA
ncbi:MAG: ferritin [Armatimonadetes bacterium CG_4_10_14_3_um_filter_66_18]|nr:ferritin [Armatimonadota bacterium]OIP09558.1 MAG: ferritin [Armatimonadetes bacterium CG2_30_66_41]PIU89004.1 MAG: ferritin [Armatimonadetes bacterium CG06_land_8_20_14_3_00_66_21]PIX37082.1 MAG: ferritin [Armatimonadetes bacterium CG_4_8_14_3_um_filter_66_20]PIY48926.1 MAG: ferritin [Armatimonadetes bacterium CG_4_10_14_3_um_filter_66_18]PIZ34836.1 MAG: ferritin [Armatimonadetes bacterium CG_4_10_14_0_8_um_filter_66_14]PJB70329.1 MAG: ferritin [Armatimonadetes bacterium CG_4_9_14_3_um_fi